MCMPSAARLISLIEHPLQIPAPVAEIAEDEHETAGAIHQLVVVAIDGALPPAFAQAERTRARRRVLRRVDGLRWTDEPQRRRPRTAILLADGPDTRRARDRRIRRLHLLRRRDRHRP